MSAGAQMQIGNSGEMALKGTLFPRAKHGLERPPPGTAGLGETLQGAGEMFPLGKVRPRQSPVAWS